MSDTIDRTVERLVALEPNLRGRESQVAVVIVQALDEFLKERSESAKKEKGRS
jgi:hypothetical protein